MKHFILASAFALTTSLGWGQETSYQLSSHILDINKGMPAAGVRIALSKMEAGEWHPVEEKTTDENGRIKDFLEENGHLLHGALLRVSGTREFLSLYRSGVRDQGR